MLMKVACLTLFSILFGVRVGAQNGASNLLPSTPQIEAVARSADVYKIDRKEAVANFEKLRSPNRSEGLRAADYFEKHQAYEIAAAALADVKDRNVEHYLIQTLAKKKDFSFPVANALIAKLEKFNQTIPDNDELRAGTEAAKGQIATVVAKWLGMPDPKIPFEPFKSQAAYAQFSAQAKARAATVGSGSPF